MEAVEDKIMILEETKDYAEVLRDCYSSDQEFIDKYHDIPSVGVEKCVERDVALFHTVEGYVMYDVKSGSDRIGYFGVDRNFEPPFMLGFFVKPEFRNGDVLSEFWENVRNTFDSDFLGECSHNNAKAINHLIKNGGQQLLKNKKIIVFKFKN